VKEDPGKAASLAVAMQKLTAAHKAQGLKTFIVFTGGPELKDPVQKLAAEKSITIPMTFLPQGTGAADYGYYKINPQAKNTILVYNRHKVHASFVDVTGASWNSVESATAKMLTE